MSSTHHYHWWSFTLYHVADFAISTYHCLAEMHSTAHPCWFCMKERAECYCQAVSVSILRHIDKTRSLSAVLLATNDSVVIRWSKCGKCIPPANVFFFAISLPSRAAVHRSPETVCFHSMTLAALFVVRGKQEHMSYSRHSLDSFCLTRKIHETSNTLFHTKLDKVRFLFWIW